MSPTGGGKTYLACALAIGACESEHSVLYFRMDDLARKLVIARGDAIAHQKLLNELSNIDLLIIDDFLTVGIDSDAGNDLFAILANREHRLPTMIASQTGPAHWVAELPDRVAADSIVNRLASSATTKPAPRRATGNNTTAARAPSPGCYHLVRTLLPSAWTGATIKRYSPANAVEIRQTHLTFIWLITQ
ncbi:ATP-binding protein [Cryobacterium sp. TMS1-20-1]|uniref:ATP-binding protein n=1 Tax=Cryobacterium sp. TMS1-20-1 TaxID=1259223 RepID=UPI001F542549